MEIEKFVGYIKESRKRGFRDDTIRKSLLDKHWPESWVNKAFSLAGKPKRAELRSRVDKDDSSEDPKTSITILLEDWLKDALEKKAEKNNLTLYNEVKKILVKSIKEKEIPKEVDKSRIIRRKLTREEKNEHNKSNKKYKQKVKKERIKGARIKIGKKEDREDE